MTGPRRNSVLGRYSFLWSSPGVPALVASGAAGRLLYVSMPFCLLAYGLSARSGALFGTALSAAFAAAAAVGIPVTAGWAANRRPGPVLAGCGLVATVGLVGVVALQSSGRPWAIAAAAVAGLAFPPFGPLARTIWPEQLRDDNLVHRALAFEASLTELLSVVGPALVAGLTALASAGASVLVFAGGTLLATLGFGVRYAGRAPSPGGQVGSAADGQSAPAGRVAGGRLAVLFGAVLVSAAALGALQVCLSVGQRAAGHSAASAGLYLALLAIGSVVGGLGYGLARRPASRFVRYGWTLAGLAVALVLVAVTLGQPALPVVMVLAGLPFAAAATEEFGLAQDLSTPRQAARVTGLLLSAYGGGEALGVLAAGLLVEPVSERNLLLLSAAAVLAAAGLVAPHHSLKLTWGNGLRRSLGDDP